MKKTPRSTRRNTPNSKKPESKSDEIVDRINNHKSKRNNSKQKNKHNNEYEMNVFGRQKKTNGKRVLFLGSKNINNDEGNRSRLKPKKKVLPLQKINNINNKNKLNKKNEESSAEISNQSDSFNYYHEESHKDSEFQNSLLEQELKDDILDQGIHQEDLKKNRRTKYKTPIKNFKNDQEILSSEERLKKASYTFFDNKAYKFSQSTTLSKELAKMVSYIPKINSPVIPTKRIDKEEIDRYKREEIEKEMKENYQIVTDYEMIDPYFRFSPTRRNQLIRNEISVTNINLDMVRIPSNKKKYINLKLVSQKSKITNVELLLSILEIAKNYKYYQFQDFSNKSKCFWENVITVEELKRIFDKLHLNAETLRKYWRSLKTIIEIEKITENINQNKEFIESTNIKVKYLIDLMTDYSNLDNSEQIFIQFFEANFENYLSYNKRIDSQDSMEEAFLPDNEFIEKLYQPFSFEEPKFRDHSINKKSNKKIENYQYNKETTLNKFDLMSKDRDFQLKETLSHLSRVFPQYNNDIFIHCLNMSSMDTQFTEEFLSNPEELYESSLLINLEFGFNSMEDHVIKKMKNSDIYKLIVKIKGKKAVDEREEFLK